jgi:hypothetical protein
MFSAFQKKNPVLRNINGILVKELEDRSFGRHQIGREGNIKLDVKDRGCVCLQ